VLRLTAALALTALPVLLTALLLRLTVLVPFAAPGWLRQPYGEFAAYALANWIAFALLLAVVGWDLLRGYGLRLRVTAARCIVAAVGFVAGVLIYLVVGALLRRFGLPPVRGMDIAAPTAAEAAVMLLSVALTAAFCEEVFFRVLWIGALRTVVPVWIAAATSLAAFAAIHYPYFGLGGVVFITVWALVPIAMFVVFGDVTAPVLMHVLNNTFAYVLVPLLFAPPK
jgi:membrane protease YdiL (CAAX protease family)